MRLLIKLNWLRVKKIKTINESFFTLFPGLNHQVMNDWVVIYNCVDFTSLFICFLKAIVAFPEPWGEHFASLMNEVATADRTYFSFFFFVNVGPALGTSELKLVIILGWFFWDVILGEFLSILCLDGLNLLSAVRTALIELPPAFGAVNTAELVLAVECGEINRIDFIETDSTHLNSGSWSFVLRFWSREGFLGAVVSIFGDVAGGSFLHVIGQK